VWSAVSGFPSVAGPDRPATLREVRLGAGCFEHWLKLRVLLSQHPERGQATVKGMGGHQFSNRFGIIVTEEQCPFGLLVAVPILCRIRSEGINCRGFHRSILLVFASCFERFARLAGFVEISGNDLLNVTR
jgi:hypothetical protein